jgi:hypothetical protein
MEQSTSQEAYICSATQEIPSSLLDPEGLLWVDNNPQLVPILIRMNQVRNLPHYFFRIPSSVILPSTSISSN